MEVGINDIIGDYKIKVIMYEPTDNFSVRFILINLKNYKCEVFNYDKMKKLIESETK